jgi:hypothetical protein
MKNEGGLDTYVNRDLIKERSHGFVGAKKV